MAKFHGKKANVFWQGGTVQISAQSWSAEVTGDVAEVTEMQDDWKRYIPGLTNWTAKVVALHQGSAASKISLDSAAGSLGYDIPAAGDEAKLDLYLVYDTGEYNAIYGDAICVGISPIVDSKDAGKVSYAFQGVGSVSVHSATSVHTY